MKCYVGIATKGRPEILAETLRVLEGQTCPPDRVVICPASSEDLPNELLQQLQFDVQVVSGPTGLTSQRNAVISASNDADILVFIDDDFFLAADYLEKCQSLFRSQPDVVVATGKVIADGIHGLGIDPTEGKRLLQAGCAESPEPVDLIYGGYGCNMAFRMATIRNHELRFDEKLPLYGWQEDIDFSRQMSKYGKIVKDLRLTGVHLGHKGGRGSGIRFGYSQIANPVYLCRKGTMAQSFAYPMMTRNVLKNVLRFAFPESHVDRRGRLYGNFIALGHWIRGKLDPEAVLTL